MAGREIADLMTRRSIGIHHKDGEVSKRIVSAGESDEFSVRRPVTVPGNRGSVGDCLRLAAVERGFHQVHRSPRSCHVEHLFAIWRNRLSAPRNAAEVALI